MREALKIASKFQDKEKFLQKPQTFGLCDTGKQKKTRYSTHKDGQTQIEIIALKNPVLAKQLHTYRCKKCNYIHLGHHEQMPALSGQRRKRLKQISSVWNLQYIPRKNRIPNRFAKFIVKIFFKELADVLDRATSELLRDGEE